MKNLMFSLSLMARLGVLDNTTGLVYFYYFWVGIIPYKLIRMLTVMVNTTLVYLLQHKQKATHCVFLLRLDLPVVQITLYFGVPFLANINQYTYRNEKTTTKQQQNNNKKQQKQQQ